MKRFTDTEMWAKPWFRKLPPKYKALWQYIRDKCDNSGVWVKDWELAVIFIGESISEVDALKLINNGKERIRVIDNGEKWFIVDFIDFQYGKLSDKSMPHLQVIRLLAKHRLSKGYAKGRHTLKDKDKDKDKDIKKGEYEGKTKALSFEEIWAKYPKRVGKKDAERHFNASVKTEKDWQDINTALKNYLESERVAKGFILNGSTFFNNWRDWVDYKEPVCPICRNTGKYISDKGFEMVCKCPAGKRVGIPEHRSE